MGAPKNTVAWYTLGCKLNFSESSSLARKFEEKGYTLVDIQDSADIYIINSCAVTVQAERKTRQTMRKIRKQHPGALIIITGCYAQLRADELKAEADIVLGNDEKFRIFDYIENVTIPSDETVYTKRFNQLQRFDPAFSTKGRTRSFLKIQDGCDHWCTYCTIPMARGRSRNDTIKNITAEAREIARQGFKEIVLTGVNVGDFGKSTGESFISLLRKLDEIPGISRYRISSIEPELLTDEIIQFTANSRKFLPHYHIPLQSGNNEILKKMNRPYTRELFAGRIQKIREILPEAFIGIDVITGFPGEDEAHFIDTYNFIDSLDISFLHVFSYSDRPGTQSAGFQNKIPGNKIKTRSEKLHELSEKKHQKFYKAQKGKTGQALFENQDNNGWMFGFTENYTKVGVPFNEKLSNTIKQVKLKHIHPEGFFTAEFSSDKIRIKNI